MLMLTAGCIFQLILLQQLRISFIDSDFLDEFDPGVDLSKKYTKQINDAVKIYRNNLYHAYDQINMNVAQVKKQKPKHSTVLDTFNVAPGLCNKITNAGYFFDFDFTNYNNPYIKIDWVLKKPNSELWINCCESWRSIAFQVDKNKGKKVYIRFNSLTHELIGTQC